MVVLQLIAMKKPCLRNQQELRKAYRSSTITELNHDNEDLYGYLTTHTGQNVSNITAVELLYNTLEIEASLCYDTGTLVFWWTWPVNRQNNVPVNLTIIKFKKINSVFPSMVFKIFCQTQ